METKTSVAILDVQTCTLALTESLGRNFHNPQVFSVEDVEVIEGQHMPHEQRVQATCSYMFGAEHFKQTVEFYWDEWDETCYVDSPIA